jgi:hypothetical protein
MKLALILSLAGALAGLPSLAMAQKDPDAAGVAEAIRFEKAKQAAADRQARIEARDHGLKSEDHTATESKPKTKTVKSATARRTPPPQRNPQ